MSGIEVAQGRNMAKDVTEEEKHKGEKNKALLEFDRKGYTRNDFRDKNSIEDIACPHCALPINGFDDLGKFEQVARNEFLLDYQCPRCDGLFEMEMVESWAYHTWIIGKKEECHNAC